MATLLTGSMTTRTILSKGIRAGRSPRRQEIAAPPYHAVPSGQVGGVDEPDRTALCGVVCVHVFPDHPWRRGFGSGTDWCARCTELAGG